jgi:putative isomerase
MDASWIWTGSLNNMKLKPGNEIHSFFLRLCIFQMIACCCFIRNTAAQDISDFSTPGHLSKKAAIYRDAVAKWKSGLPEKFFSGTLSRDTIMMLGEKCIFTLLNNRQGAEGGLKHEGIYPSWKDFTGFWAWDSWKQAYALAGITPELAKNNIRAMFDYQDSCGMVADCIFTDTLENNYRDTKPPLAAWAVLRIVRMNNDSLFAREMLPKLMKYHRWWYSHRDHDGNGLCEYGSTDGTIQAARWESGWDNAVRFDSAVMVRNNDHAFSMSQESADLNSYLYVEKLCLAGLAGFTGEKENSEELRKEAAFLAEQISQLMWDEQYGFFFDIILSTKKTIPVPEPNGWIPLWAGIANGKQAGRIKEHIMNPAEFNTFVPFPTVAAGHPGFNPEKGYWRGPVWLDQAWFAIDGLMRYGYEKEAGELTEKLLMNCEGLLDPVKPIRENYHPLTGQGLNAEFFSWSAAHILMLIGENGKERLR